MIISIACGLLKTFTLPLDSDALDKELRRRRQRKFKAKFRELPILLSKKGGIAPHLWYQILIELALGLGLNQIIAGLGLLICTLAKYPVSTRDPHATLAHSMSLLSMASQALVIPSLQFSSLEMTNLRIWLTCVYTYIFIIPSALGLNKTHDVTDLVGAVLCGQVICLSAYFGTKADPPRSLLEQRVQRAMGETLYRSASGKRKALLALTFTTGAAFSTYYLSRVMQLKFDPGYAGGCDMNTAKENEWTLGQIFALVMLAALLLPAREIYNSMY